MTVFIYVDTSKDVGDPDHLKVFASQDGLRRTIRKAWPLSMRFRSERGRLRWRPPCYDCGHAERDEARYG